MKKRLFLFAVSSVACVFVIAQKLPNTLLWRISGHGLQKPSYLYGTVHLSDERFSVLGDSVIQAIKNSDGFALELDPTQMSPLIVEVVKQNIMHGSEIKNVMSEKSLKRYGPALAKRFKKPVDQITTNDIFTEKKRLALRGMGKEKMTSFLDGYLCHLAYDQGKWIGGVEDYMVQAGLADNLVDESDIRQLAISEGSSSDNSLKTLVGLYLNADLNAIDSMMNQTDSAYRDKLLVSRNVRMVSRMDSLSRIRTMVFAVGCAHLPGRKGLIQLLKNAGYQVDPVFFSKKLAAKDYQTTPREKVWVNVEGSSGHYHVSMPGTPAELNMAGIFQMKIYFDVFDNSTFFASSFSSPFTGKTFDSVKDDMADRIFTSHQGKEITINGISGWEYLIKSEDGYRRGYILKDGHQLYMAAGIAENSSSGNMGVIDHFLHSFEPKRTDNADDAVGFHFVDSVMAFSVDFPSRPTSGNDLVKTVDPSIQSNLLVGTDQATGAYYMVNTNCARRSFRFLGDSLNAATVRSNVIKKLGTVSRDTMFLKGNRWTMEIDGQFVQNNLTMKSVYVFRGNRYYGMLVMRSREDPSENEKRFFNSFHLLDYSKGHWSTKYYGDSLFSIWSPSNISVKYQNAEDGSLARWSYSMYDTSSSNSYELMRYSYGKYYWQKNDSSLLESLGQSYTKNGDSLLYKKIVTAGGLTGFDLATQPAGTRNFIRRRTYILGDSLLELETTQELADLDNPDINRFFTDLKLYHPAPPTNIFKSKATLLLADLSAPDSATREAATQALTATNFAPTDIPALCDELMKIAEEKSSEYETSQIRLTNHIVKTDDSYALSFSRKNYPLVKNGAVRDDLLFIMGARKTKDNFDSIAQLMVRYPMPIPPGSDLKNIFRNNDSLSAVMFPTLLPLLRDSNNASFVIDLLVRLLDSGKLATTVLHGREQLVLDYANGRLQSKQKDSDDYRDGDAAVLRLLGKLASPQGNATLKGWLSIHGNSYLKYKTVTALLENDQPVRQAAIDQLAADRNFRTSIYDLLKKNHKQSLFPATYRTQGYFAESLAYAEASEDMDPDKFKFIRERKMLFKGKYYKFFFYKCLYPDSSSSKLACAGPFNMDAQVLSRDIASSDLSKDYYTESKKEEDQEQALVRQMEDWYHF